MMFCNRLLWLKNLRSVHYLVIGCILLNIFLFIKLRPKIFLLGTNSIRRLESCVPNEHLFFMKTHKTGSTSLLNILYRHAYEKNHDVDFIQYYKPNDEKSKTYNFQWNNNELKEQKLFVGIPPQNSYFGHPARFNRGFLKTKPWQLPKNGRVDILPHHMRLDIDEVKAVTYNDTVWMTVIRNPVDSFVSMMSYYGMGSVENIQERIRKGDRFLRTKDAQRFGANQFAYDMGMDVTKKLKKEEIQNYILKIEANFDLVILNDRFDEGLVILADQMCWDLDNIVYWDHNVQVNNKSTKINEAERKYLEEINYIDMMFYEHFSSVFNDLVYQYDEEFVKIKVLQLRLRKQQIKDFCVKKLVEGNNPDAAYKPYSSKVFAYELKRKNNPLCQAFAKVDLSYMFQMKAEYIKIYDNKMEKLGDPRKD